MPNRFSDFIFFCAQHGRYLAGLRLFHFIIFESPYSAEHSHSGAAFISLYICQFDHPDLTGMYHMGRAARTDVISRNHNNPHLTLDLNLAAVFHLRKFLFRRIERLDLQILPHCPVCLKLYL